MSDNLEKKSIYSRIFPGIGLVIGICAMFASIFSAVIFYYGSTNTKLIIISILVYQYIFAKKSDIVRRFLKFFRVTDYFNSYKIIIDEELQKERSLFVIHPHGVCGVGYALLQGYCEFLFENSVGLVSSVLLNLPISGLLAKWMGGQPVKKKNFENFMQLSKIQFLLR